MRIAPCSNCGGGNLHRSKPISAGGGYAPNYLPGLGGFLHAGRFELVVCRDCGLTRFFATPEAREKLGRAGAWRRVSS